MKHTTRLIACLLALALTACTAAPQDMPAGKIGRASCRERVSSPV